jgi:hypothetical protein
MASHTGSQSEPLLTRAGVVTALSVLGEGAYRRPPVPVRR